MRRIMLHKRDETAKITLPNISEIQKARYASYENLIRQMHEKGFSYKPTHKDNHDKIIQFLSTIPINAFLVNGSPLSTYTWLSKPEILRGQGIRFKLDKNFTVMHYAKRFEHFEDLPIINNTLFSDLRPETLLPSPLVIGIIFKDSDTGICSTPMLSPWARVYTNEDNFTCFSGSAFPAENAKNIRRAVPISMRIISWKYGRSLLS